MSSSSVEYVAGLREVGVGDSLQLQEVTLAAARLVSNSPALTAFIEQLAQLLEIPTLASQVRKPV
ncbi:hypothetical protein EV652_13119 [Kribbella steppae]|uniref:Uncharacterized protein n=1 Tax=Kribbella steppae TaxID=2512223 RepID=A0A4R2GR10_9ACTN|nr:hypothetical protein [Kribbella steppae]TCO12221.1 hypothetical protein EV652_13119 [Kribbella steppae]